MKNTDIKYDLKTDYKELYSLLKKGCKIIGFIAISIDNNPDFEYSKLIDMSYNSSSKMFDVGACLFGVWCEEVNFIRYCKKENIRYLQPNEA